jgi:hypothetical protein
MPGLAPSRASRSEWWNPRSSHSCRRALASSRAGRRACGARRTGPVSGRRLRRRLARRRAAALPAGDRAHRDEHRPAGLGVGDVEDLAGPAAPSQAVSWPRSRAKSTGGDRSLGRSDTWSPAVTTLPSRAVRRTPGSSERTTAAGPVTVSRAASTRGATSTSTGSPSRSRRFDSTSSSHRTLPGGPSPVTAIAAVVRAPRIRSTHPSEAPRAASACCGSRTMPCRSYRA